MRPGMDHAVVSLTGGETGQGPQMSKRNFRGSRGHSQHVHHRRCAERLALPIKVTAYGQFGRYLAQGDQLDKIQNWAYKGSVSEVVKDALVLNSAAVDVHKNGGLVFRDEKGESKLSFSSWRLTHAP
jgi:hypothetical protein